MEKEIVLKVLEELKHDVNGAYQESDDSAVDAKLMRAYGRIDTLIKFIRG